MPPKTVKSLAVTQRATADPVKDQWSANPFKSTDPRHEQYEVQQRIAQREAAVSRVGHTIAKDMRTHDFSIGGVAMGRSTTAADYASRQKRQQDTTAMRSTSIAAATPTEGTTAADGSVASPADGISGTPLTNTTADLTAVPSRLQAPQSFVEESLSMPGLTCSAVLQGGSLVVVGTRDGTIVAINGFNKSEVARVKVTDPIAKSDRELEEEAREDGRDATRRPQRKARRGDGEAHSAAMTQQITEQANIAKADDGTTDKKKESRVNKETTSEDSDSGNAGAYPIAVSALGESSFVAFVLSNKKVRVYDAMTLAAVDEINIKTEEEEKAESDSNANTNTTSNANNTNPYEDDDHIPFAAVLPVDCVADPIFFFVVCRDRVVALNLTQPDTLADRPHLAVTRIKTYEKLGLHFVSAATDNARTIVFAGDDGGDIWTVDVSDLMVVDSWPVVPPPPPPPNTKKEQRKAATTSRTSSPRRDAKEKRQELATAVGAFGEYIFAGTSAGRVVVYQKQPYGEKPLPIFDEPNAHGTSGIVGAVADDRALSVWFASEDGVVSCWSLADKKLTYKTSIPIAAAGSNNAEDTKKQKRTGAVTAFAMLPHAITNKVWTITISGINKVWLTEDHQTHDEMGVTHTHMEDVLSRQGLAVEQKEEEVAQAEGIMLCRLNKIVEAMAEQNRQRILRAYYCAWVTARLKAITRRKREDAAEALNNSAVYLLARSYYLRLVANMTAQRARKQIEAAVRHLRTQREDELRSRYYNAMRKYVLERRQASHRDLIATSIAQVNASSSMLPFFLDRWRRFADGRRKAKYQEQYKQLIGRVEGRRTAHSAFAQWMKFTDKKRLQHEQARSVSILGDNASNALVRAYYCRWAALSQARKAKEQREKWVRFVNACHEKMLLQSAFATLCRYRLTAVRGREEAAAAEAAQKKSALETQYAAVAPIVEREERVRALKAQLAALEAAKLALQRDEGAVMQHNAALRRKIADAPNPLLETLRGATTPQRIELLKLMGRLRNMIINVEYDAAIINKVLGRAKAETVVATFGEYVGDLKATILIPPTAVPTAAGSPTRTASQRQLNASNNAEEVAAPLYEEDDAHGHQQAEGGGNADDANAPATPSKKPSPITIATSTTTGSPSFDNKGAEWPSDEGKVMKIVADAGPMQSPLLQTIKGIVIAFDAMSVSEMEHVAAEGELGGELIAHGDTLCLLAELLQAAIAANKKKMEATLAAMGAGASMSGTLTRGASRRIA